MSLGTRKVITLLHNHPHMEQYLDQERGVKMKNHVIVDRNEWETVKKFLHDNPTIAADLAQKSLENRSEPANLSKVLNEPTSDENPQINNPEVMLRRNHDEKACAALQAYAQDIKRHKDACTMGCDEDVVTPMQDFAERFLTTVSAMKQHYDCLPDELKPKPEAHAHDNSIYK